VPILLQLTPPPPEVFAPGVLAERAIAFVGRIAAMLRQDTPFAERAAELGGMAAPDLFRHVDREQQERDWQQFVALLAGAAPVALDYDVLRVREAGNIVFVELEQRTIIGGNAVRLLTISVFEYDASARLRRLDSYR
jgi:hypothetical protein